MFVFEFILRCSGFDISMDIDIMILSWNRVNLFLEKEPERYLADLI